MNPDLSISRIDAATARLAGRIPVKATGAIAADEHGVWFVGDGPSVTRVDPRTNRIGQTIKVTASSLVGLALGAGSIWATDPVDGLVWRIDPGLHAVTRTISVGFGVTHIAFGNGAVWTANFIEGTVSRIDPSTNSVTATIRTAGTPQGIAVGGGSAWVSVIGETRRGVLPRTSCGGVESGGRRPDVIIASDLPLQGSGAAVTRSMADGVRYILRQHGFKAGKYAIGYQSCDDSSAQGGGYDYFKCGANAKAYARAAQLVAVIGTYNSGCAEVEIPIANRAPGGPLPMISPANTNRALTRGGITGLPGFPGVYYPTGVRNYVRLAAPDDLQGAGDAVLVKELGLKRVYVLADGEAFGKVVAAGFRSAAGRLGFRIAGSAGWDAGAKGYAALADRVGHTRAGGVFLAGYGNGKLIKALRSRLGRKVVLIAPDGFVPIRDVLATAGPAALGMYVSVAGVTNDKLGQAGRRFLQAFASTHPGGAIASGTYLPQAAQAAELLLQAIAGSDGTRASVLSRLKTLRVRNGILGSFRFDRNGDMRPSLITILRVVGKTPTDLTLVADYRGAVVDRRISVPEGLLP